MLASFMPDGLSRVVFITSIPRGVAFDLGATFAGCKYLNQITLVIKNKLHTYSLDIKDNFLAACVRTFLI
jgi:hypothetical protein